MNQRNAIPWVVGASATAVVMVFCWHVLDPVPAWERNWERPLKVLGLAQQQSTLVLQDPISPNKLFKYSTATGAETSRTILLQTEITPRDMVVVAEDGERVFVDKPVGTLFNRGYEQFSFTTGSLQDSWRPDSAGPAALGNCLGIAPSGDYFLVSKATEVKDPWGKAGIVRQHEIRRTADHGLVWQGQPLFPVHQGTPERPIFAHILPSGKFALVEVPLPDDTLGPALVELASGTVHPVPAEAIPRAGILPSTFTRYDQLFALQKNSMPAAPRFVVRTAPDLAPTEVLPAVDPFRKGRSRYYLNFLRHQGDWYELAAVRDPPALSPWWLATLNGWGIGQAIDKSYKDRGWQMLTLGGEELHTVVPFKPRASNYLIGTEYLFCWHHETDGGFKLQAWSLWQPRTHWFMLLVLGVIAGGGTGFAVWLAQWLFGRPRS